MEADKRDHEKPAFIMPDGLYEFKVIPFKEHLGSLVWYSRQSECKD